MKVDLFLTRTMYADLPNIFANPPTDVNTTNSQCDQTIVSKEDQYPIDEPITMAMKGYFVALVDGTYVFYLLADDYAMVYFSKTDSPDDKVILTF